MHKERSHPIVNKTSCLTFKVFLHNMASHGLFVAKEDNDFLTKLISFMIMDTLNIVYFYD